MVPSGDLEVGGGRQGLQGDEGSSFLTWRTSLACGFRSRPRLPPRAVLPAGALGMLILQCGGEAGGPRVGKGTVATQDLSFPLAYSLT